MTPQERAADLAAAAADPAVQRAVDAAPPLSPEQTARLRTALAPLPDRQSQPA
jgi:hypothetical protein